MYFEYNLRFDDGSWEMITKVETRATTFFLLIEIQFRKYENFDAAILHFLSFQFQLIMKN